MDLLFRLLSGAAAAGDVRVEEWPAVLSAADAHQVGPLLAQRMLRHSIPDHVRATLAALQEATARSNMLRLRDFAAAATALEAHGIPVLALKGLQLAPLVYRSLAARAMIDVDLLVPTAHLAAAGAVMTTLGYEPRTPYTVTPEQVAHHLPPLLKPGATTVELHWHICDPGTPAIDIDELWSRAVPARIAGVDTRVFAIEDLLLHLAVHATYAHRCDVSARACCDLAEIVRTQPVSWDAVVERARRWNVGAGTYLVLRIAREIFSTPIPPEVLDALAPREFDERLLRMALRGRVERNPAAPLRHAPGPIAKLRALKNLLVPSLDALADAEQVPRSSARVYALPLRRAVRVARRWREVVAVVRDDEALAETAAVDRFLRQPSK